MRKRAVIGNWKVNLLPDQGCELINQIVKRIKNFPPDLILGIAPGHLLLDRCCALARGSNLWIGAQNALWESWGAYTGEVSIDQVKALGGSFVIIGHSERRHTFGESIDLCARRASFALERGLPVVFCIGETREERVEGKTTAVIEHQLTALLDRISEQMALDLIVGYEPVWAIGTGLTPTPQEVASTHRFIRDLVAQHFTRELSARTPVLYGGSVVPENAATLLAAGDVDGFIPGKASLDCESFIAIAESLA